MNSQEILKAIAAHGMWKRRLKSAIEAGHSDVTPEQVAPANLCAFGKWLQTLPSSEHSEHFKKVQPLHATFHKEAAHVLKLVLSGNSAEANKSIAAGGSYTIASAKLTEAMMGWGKAIA